MGTEARLVFLGLPEGVTIDGLSEGSEFRLGDASQVVIGRVLGADIRVHGAMIGGRKNCSVERRGAGWALRHAGHSLPIFVNGEELAPNEAHTLAEGDIVHLGAAGDVTGPTFVFRS